MTVTLEWVRDNYDVNKNRYIDDTELNQSVYDYTGGGITKDQYLAVKDAFDKKTLLPAYDSSGILFSSVPPGVNITFTEV